MTRGQLALKAVMGLAAIAFAVSAATRAPGSPLLVTLSRAAFALACAVMAGAPRGNKQADSAVGLLIAAALLMQLAV